MPSSLAPLKEFNDEQMVGVIDKDGGYTGEDSTVNEFLLEVGVSFSETRRLLLFGLGGVEKLEISSGGGQELGLGEELFEEALKLTGETVLPLCSNSLCCSRSCFFLPASVLNIFRQLRQLSGSMLS